MEHLQQDFSDSTKKVIIRAGEPANFFNGSGSGLFFQAALAPAPDFFSKAAPAPVFFQEAPAPAPRSQKHPAPTGCGS